MNQAEITTVRVIAETQTTPVVMEVEQKEGQQVVETQTLNHVALQSQPIHLEVLDNRTNLEVGLCAKPALVTIITEGPQGPRGDVAGAFPFGGLLDVDSTPVDGSVPVFNEAEQRWKANENWTTATLVDGGNW